MLQGIHEATDEGHAHFFSKKKKKSAKRGPEKQPLSAEAALLRLVRDRSINDTISEEGHLKIFNLSSPRNASPTYPAQQPGNSTSGALLSASAVERPATRARRHFDPVKCCKLTFRRLSALLKQTSETYHASSFDVCGKHFWRTKVSHGGGSHQQAMQEIIPSACSPSGIRRYLSTFSVWASCHSIFPSSLHKA